MNLLMLADIHGRGDYIGQLSDEFRLADLVVLTGDITHFGKEDQVSSIVDMIRNYHTPIIAVTGNCDHPEVEVYLQKEELSIHLSYSVRGDYNFAGISGSLPCPGSTLQEYSEEEFGSFLELIKSFRKDVNPLILVSHQPPYNTKNDRIMPGLHVGSKAIRSFIETEKPLLCLCGHIHEGIGLDYIGSTLIVNPGPFRSGNYARIRLDGSGVSAELRDIRNKTN